MQELWFATRRIDWKTLVVVPASPGESAVAIAQALGEVGGLIRMSPVQVINAERFDLPRIAALVTDMTDDGPAPRAPAAGSRLPQGKAMIIATDPVTENPLILPIALAADAVLLCVVQGETDLSSARHAIEVIGRDRIVGSVLLNKK